MWKAVRFWLDMEWMVSAWMPWGRSSRNPPGLHNGQPYTLEDLYRIERVAKLLRKNRMRLRRWESIFHNQYDQPGVQRIDARAALDYRWL